MAVKFLVTGANGFVGRSLCAELLRQGRSVRAALRKTLDMNETDDRVIVGNIDGTTKWDRALQDVDVVIHLAARVHVMSDTAADPLAEFRNVNLHGTINLATQAVKAGVKRLVYVSSIKVNGEETPAQRTYSEADTPAPQDPYGISKWEAEQALHKLSQETGLEVVIVRPALVYGPGVKGNFISLLAAVNKGVPLPLAGAHNLRSLVYVGNLSSALIACAIHPAAVGQTYLVSDGQDVSTAELVCLMAEALGVDSQLFNLPAALLWCIAALSGRRALLVRVLGSLRVDSAKLRTEVNWTPLYTMKQGLALTADWYLSRTP